MKFSLTLFLFLFPSSLAIVPMQHPMNSAYNNFWDGAVGGRGYWGSTPAPKANAFSKSFKKNGLNQVYNLNSNSPYAQNRLTGFDSMVPYYSPHGASRYTFYPTKSNYLSNGELGAFSYDINEPRYQELYKQYYRFFNKNLNRAGSQLKYESLNHDLNNDRRRRDMNPHSYDYKTYFDGYDETSSLPGISLPYLGYKESSTRESENKRHDRRLKEVLNKTFLSSKKQLLSRKLKIQKKKIEKLEAKRLKRRIKKMRAKLSRLEEIEDKREERRVEQVRPLVEDEVVRAVDLKPYLFDSKAPNMINL